MRTRRNVINHARALKVSFGVRASNKSSPIKLDPMRVGLSANNFEDLIRPRWLFFHVKSGTAALSPSTRGTRILPRKRSSLLRMITHLLPTTLSESFSKIKWVNVSETLADVSARLR